MASEVCETPSPSAARAGVARRANPAIATAAPTTHCRRVGAAKATGNFAFVFISSSMSGRSPTARTGCPNWLRELAAWFDVAPRRARCIETSKQNMVNIILCRRRSLSGLAHLHRGRNAAHSGGTMPYPAGHRQATKKKIIDSARRLFNRHGFESVSITQIMAGAKLTHGGFYSYFKGKSDLYAE